jgi:hypothetical protein
VTGTLGTFETEGESRLNQSDPKVAFGTDPTEAVPGPFQDQEDGEWKGWTPIVGGGGGEEEEGAGVIKKLSPMQLNILEMKAVAERRKCGYPGWLVDPEIVLHRSVPPRNS